MSDILVVDDSASRQELRQMLSSGPYNYLTCAEAGSAQRALFLVKQEQPDIVIFDLSLPDMDGIEFGKKVLEVKRRTQVVGLSYLQMFETVYQAINAGFSGYLLKPVKKFELFTVLDKIVEENLLKNTERQMKSRNGKQTGNSLVPQVDFGNPIKSVMEYIEEHFGEAISLQDVAERVYLSPSYFSRLFKSEMGVTFTEYLTQFRIQKSKFILRVTSLPVEVIANNTGFSNASYFSTTFKRFEGRTPTEYRSLFSSLQSDSTNS